MPEFITLPVLQKTMEIKVEIASKEMIKPSSPTPHHLKTLKLSFLDQMSPPIYIPFIFYYQNDLKLNHQSLKPSLSNVLTQFYPLAGRFSGDKLAIDCNDSGALFIDAKIHANLAEITKDPKMDDIDKFLPLGRVGSCCIMSEDNTIILAVQVSHFDDGGIVVTAQVHHNTADAISSVNFMNAWAAASRGDEIISPTYPDLATLCPPKDMSSYGFEPTYGMANPENIVTKRIVFDKDQLEKIKHAEKNLSRVQDLTRIEAVSAYFLRCFKDFNRSKGSKKLLIVTQAVNLRYRMDPPLPNQAFGNVWLDGLAMPVDDADMAAVMRNAVKKVDGDYVAEIQRDGDEHFNSLKKASEEIYCGFTSLWRLPFYEVDFGWGRPVWASPARFPFKNLVIFMPTSSGEGMEVWINLLQEDADFCLSN